MSTELYFLGAGKPASGNRPTAIKNIVNNMYMTSFLQEMINKGMKIHAVFVMSGWLEVDSVSDIEIYEKLSNTGELVALCKI